MKKIQFILGLIAIASIISSPCHAQWAISHGGTSDESAYCVRETADGGYVVAGQTESYGAGSDDIWVLKLDSDGSAAWQKTYGGSGADSARSIQQTVDLGGTPDGYVVAGQTESYGAGSDDVWVLRLNSNGTIAWQNTYGGTGEDLAGSIQQTVDLGGNPDGYVVAGQTRSYGAGSMDAWVLKLNSDGTVAWQNTYGGTSADCIRSIQQTFDGAGVTDGYIMAGYTISFAHYHTDFWLIKLNLDGTVAWQKAYANVAQGFDFNEAYSVCQLFDSQGNPDGYVVTGTTTHFVIGVYICVVRYDSNGNVVWDKRYGLGVPDRMQSASSIDQTFDSQGDPDGYVLAGRTENYGAGADDVWIIKLNPDGTVAWQRTYGGIGVDAGNSIQQTTDGGYVVAGYTDSYGLGDSDVWVLKLDSNGEIPECSAMGNSTVSGGSSGRSVSNTPATPQNTSVTPSDTSISAQDTLSQITVICPSPNDPPTIDSITPDNGWRTGTTAVTIAGYNLWPTPYMSIYGGLPKIKGSCNTYDDARCVYLSAEYAYVADSDSGLQIIDISNPANPFIVGSCDTPGTALGVYVAGDYAYVADGYSGLQVIDITNPTSPSIVGSCDTAGSGRGVCVSGNYAYVADGTVGLQVIDVTNPTNPSIVGSRNTPGFSYGVYISGNHAYVADGMLGLQVIDVTNPTNPSIVGSCDTSDNARSVHVSGDYAYVAVNALGLQVIDITTPTDPILVGSCNTPKKAYGVYVSGDYAYVAVNEWGLQVIDIRTSTDPILVGSCNAPENAYGVYVSGDHAYVADGSSGLQVVDIRGHYNPSLVGSCDTPDYASDVFISDGYAYVADAESGFKVIDISTPAKPMCVGSCDTPDYASDVHISADYAYVADYNSGLQVIDISNPVNPSIYGSCDTTGQASDVYVSGDHAYVADGQSGLQVINITDPANPLIVGSCDTPGHSWGVYVSGDHAYVADGNSQGLKVINVSDPANPFIVGLCVLPGSPRSVQVIGSLAYVVGGGLGPQVIDVSDPGNPFVVGSCDEPDYAGCIYVSGNHAYVSSSTSGLQIIDISNPLNPVQVSSCGIPGYASGVYLSGDNAYVTGYESGLYVVKKFVPGVDVTWLNESEITATVPVGFLPGTYNLHVSNPNSEPGMLHHAFTVKGASFTGYPTSGVVPLTVKFTDRSIGNMTDWSWDFGDGVGSSNDQHPSYEYTETGNYTVSLTVSGPGGTDTETKTGYIHVSEPSGPPIIDKIRGVKEPGKKIRIVGSHFGHTQDDSVVHLGSRTYDSSKLRIKLWSDTMIKIKLPNYPCTWFKRDVRRLKVWVTVNDLDSNVKKIRVFKPDTCP